MFLKETIRKCGKAKTHFTEDKLGIRRKIKSIIICKYIQ